MSDNSISIILPVYQDQKNLDRLLEQFRNQEKTGKWEVIVVDDGSKPPLNLGSQPAKNWQLIRNEHHQGVAVSRNRGAAQARGEHLLFFSVFLEIPDDYLIKLQSIVQTYIFDFAQHVLQATADLPLTPFQAFLADHASRVAAEDIQLSVKQSQFAAALIRKDVFQSLQGFDESMHHYGGHELDLIYRLDRVGYTRRILLQGFPLARVELSDHETTRRRLTEYGKTGLPNLLKKHAGLKKDILPHNWLWRMGKSLGITRLLESSLKKKIEGQKKLTVFGYRLYLHLIVRNAWNTR